jgi:MtN3 and saliva related transmembrane protein
MKFEIINDDVSLTMNVFVIIANIINLVYNIPQMVKTYQRKSTKDLSSWFIFLRIVGNSIWIGYAIEIDSMMMLINNIITVSSSIFIAYYKVSELYKERLEKKIKNNYNNYNNYTYDVLINNEYYNRKEIDLPTLE